MEAQSLCHSPAPNGMQTRHVGTRTRQMRCELVRGHVNLSGTDVISFVGCELVSKSTCVHTGYHSGRVEDCIRCSTYIHIFPSVVFIYFACHELSALSFCRVEISVQ